MKNKPEDDPAIVLPIAANLFGRTCQDWDEAISQARLGVRRFSWLIASEQAQEPCVPLGEREFINGLVEGLIKTKRFGRQKAFAAKWWARLAEVVPELPPIGNSGTWTRRTLEHWKDNFVAVYRQGRAETNRANRLAK